MNRRTNIINNVILLAATLAGILAVTLVGNNAYGGEIWLYVLYCLLGAILWAVVNTVAHELGHVRAGKRTVSVSFPCGLPFCFSKRKTVKSMPTSRVLRTNSALPKWCPKIPKIWASASSK